jgi:hypothetical protein
MMRAKFFVTVSVALAVILLGLFVVGTVFAQGPTPAPAPTTPWGRAWGGIWQGSATVSKAITDLLGMTAGQLLDARQAGKTLLDVAREKGVTEQQLTDALLAGRKDVVDQAVKDGRLTQEQADWMLNTMKAMAPFQLNNPFGGMGPVGGWGGMHGGWLSGMQSGARGPWGRWGGPWGNAPAAPATPAPAPGATTTT